MDYLVNIIFVRYSVSELLPFFRTLAQHTDCKYRLVANGCTEQERAVLIAEADSAKSRVEYLEGSRDTVLVHGIMLERLLEIESGAYFVFVDSDVLAIGPASFDGLLPDETEGGRCSALPLWHRPSDAVAPTSFRVLGGRFVEVEGSDVVVGCSYAAAYHTDRLRKILEERKITLASTQSDQLAGGLLNELTQMGLGFDLYDTLKIANILLHKAGYPLSVVELTNIIHVGALSGRDSSRNSDNGAYKNAKSWLRRVAPTTFNHLQRLRQRSKGTQPTESMSQIDLGNRRKSAQLLVSRLSAGDVDIDTAPDWCRDPTIFGALSALYADGRVDENRAS